jgi:hypothetical protein
MNINIDRTVDFYFSIFRKKKLFSLFKGLEDDLINQYTDLKKGLFNADFSTIQEFVLNIETGIERESYDISWSIPKASELIMDKKMNYTEVSISHLYSDFSNLEEGKLKHYGHKEVHSFEPIIVSYYLPIRELIVIDGNHRVYTAAQRENKKIKAYVLTAYANSLIMNERSYKLYSFHHNLVNLTQLCCNPAVWKFESNKSLQWSTYNGIVRLNNVFLKKIPLLIKQPYLPKAK